MLDIGCDECYFQFYGYMSQQQNMMQDYIRTSTYQRAMLDNMADFQDKVYVVVLLSHHSFHISSLRLSTLADCWKQLTGRFSNSWNDLTVVLHVWCHWNVINLLLVTCEMLTCTNSLSLKLFVLFNRFYRIV